MVVGKGPILSTERLTLRRWVIADREPFARMNADAEVMRHFVRPLTRLESDALVDRIEAQFADRGFGLWAVEPRADRAFLGFTGLVSFTSPLNVRSIAVMERLGMHRDPTDDFDHPSIPPDNPLRRHVLYRLRREEWSARRESNPQPIA